MCDFKRAVEDGATVSLNYKNRGERILDIDTPDISERIMDTIEAADPDVNQQGNGLSQFRKISLIKAYQKRDLSGLSQF